MAVGGGILAVIWGNDDSEYDGFRDVVQGVQAGSDIPVRYAAAAPTLHSLPVEAEPLSEPASDVPPEPEPLSSVEAAICAYPWDCGTALRVAACESGPDYIAGYNASGHAGTFQISPIHSWRFAARGLDFWNDATVLGWNLDVAYEIWTERWWYAWSCF